MSTQVLLLLLLYLSLLLLYRRLLHLTLLLSRWVFGLMASGVQGAILSLIQRTRAHPRFHQHYDFPSYEKGWLRTDR